jgi:hypothetical protein
MNRASFAVEILLVSLGRTLLASTAFAVALGQQAIAPCQNQNLPFAVRARDLVSRMTLEEKVSPRRDPIVR